MPTTIKLDKHIIRYKGLFDFDGLYNLMASWMKARRFWFHEGSYKHKVPLPTGAEQEILFTGDKDVTEYYKQEIKINMHLWDMTEVEVEQNGVKKTLTSARLEIVITGAVVLDVEGRFENTKILQGIRNFMNKYIIKEDVDLWADELRYRIFKLHKVIKDFLDMQAKGNEFAGYLGDQ